MIIASKGGRGLTFREFNEVLKAWNIDQHQGGPPKEPDPSPMEGNESRLEGSIAMKPGSLDLIKVFENFCREHGIQKQEIPIELWHDFTEMLTRQQMNADVCGAVLAFYLRSILDNTYEEEIRPEVLNVLKKIAYEK
jgi:hypothetical protein